MQKILKNQLCKQNNYKNAIEFGPTGCIKIGDSLR